MSSGREAGFTLLEFLVALVVLGLVSLLATGMLRFAADGEVRLSEKADAFAENIDLDRRLRRDLNGLLPLMEYDGSRPQSSFSGTAEQVSFIGTGRSGPVRRSVEIDQDDRVRFAEGRFEEKAAIYEAAGAAFSFFGRKAGEADSRWHDDWRRETDPPELVRLSPVNGVPVTVMIRAERADR